MTEMTRGKKSFMAGVLLYAALALVTRTQAQEGGDDETDDSWKLNTMEPDEAEEFIIPSTIGDSNIENGQGSFDP
jgi:hypothetical protein